MVLEYNCVLVRSSKPACNVDFHNGSPAGEFVVVSVIALSGSDASLKEFGKVLSVESNKGVRSVVAAVGGANFLEGFNVSLGGDPVNF